MDGDRSRDFWWSRAFVLDTALVVAVSAATEMLVWLGTGPGDPITGPRPIAALLPLLLAVPLWWRRRRPLLACTLVMLGLGAQAVVSGHATEGLEVLIATGVASYSVAAYSARRHAVIGLAVVAVGYAGWISQDRNVRSGRSSELWAGAFFALYLLSLWLVGAVLQARRESVAAVVRAAAVELEAERAVGEERGRLARDLHDIVSHNLSVVVVQAAGGRARAGSDDGETAATLEKIESSGRQALTEMRRLLGVLRASDGATEHDVALMPTPGVDALGPLIDGIRQAGVQVELTVQGHQARFSPTVDLTVYRIVQEALTNVLKHAGHGVQAQVTVIQAHGDVTVTVIDDGCGPGRDPGLGHGLRGMRERVALLGGDLIAGGRPEGGFAVTARLPVEEPA